MQSYTHNKQPNVMEIPLELFSLFSLFPRWPIYPMDYDRLQKYWLIGAGGRKSPIIPLGKMLGGVCVSQRQYQKVSEWPEYKMRIHPVAYDQLRVIKFHTQRSFSDLINFLIKEGLENEGTKRKLQDMYRSRVSQYWINDWRDNQ